MVLCSVPPFLVLHFSPHLYTLVDLLEISLLLPLSVDESHDMLLRVAEVGSLNSFFYPAFALLLKGGVKLVQRPY